MRRLSRIAALAAGFLGVLLALGPDPARAVPSYSRQTGQECAVCHVGSFGPALTPYGVRFKLGGYVDTSGTDLKVPLSGMAVGTFTQTQAGQPGGAAKFFGDNDNLALQEASLFIAGKLGGDVGTFTQITYSGVDRKLALDNVDIRGARDVTLGGQSALVGLTFNNNPTVQDPFNSLPAWRIPFISSDLAPTPSRAALMDGGLSGRVAGVSAYSLLGNGIYAELGGYLAMPKGVLDAVNVLDRRDPGQYVDSVAPYGRLGYFLDMKSQAFYAGVVGMTAGMRGYGLNLAGNDRYDDVGVDASYQFLGSRTHVFTLTGSLLYERAHLDQSVAAGLAAKTQQDLTELNLAASYYYDRTYGFTARYFNTVGNRDTTLNASRTGKPDSSGMMFQVDWTPFGKEDSWMAPNANVRLGLQYTLYNKFDGSHTNYDGAGRNASDNNTALAFVWVAF
ncbi:hypothetical protein NK718_14275 [Alsobacter sp. SYSU M60028]|uniref:Cytochrome c domain-containing protein n=1 Tax=Alsobacter ponti TaxID=2962936 RepID=A0ABT1LDV8_9HYPH|nr:hypothetical protein [Alsobacter ponti]MCP8939691.1 hypothetical protein [Alsobacter ponti]